MTSVMRPGRGLITTTRSERNTASGIEWVTKTTAAPVSAVMRASSVCRYSRVISSSAPNGSSISSSRGRVGEGARDRDALLHPAGELVGIAVGEVGQAHELGELGDPRGALRGATVPCSSSGSEMFAATVRQGSSPDCWNAMP